MPEKPSPLTLLLGIVVLLGGIVTFAAFLITAILGIGDDMTSFRVPGQTELRVAEAGEFTIFHEYRTVIDDEVYSGPPSVSGLDCQVTHVQSGEQVAVRAMTASVTYEFSSRSGYGVLEFDATQPGLHVVACDYISSRPDGFIVLTVGKDFVGALLVTIFGGIGILFGSMVLAIILFVVYGKKRGAYRRAMAVYY